MKGVIEMEYDGKLTISRVSGGENYISIRLEDANSHMIVADIKVSPEIFGEIITGLSHQPVKYGVYDFSKLGKQMEFKVEQVVIEYNGYSKEDTKNALKVPLKQYEVGGWEADIDGSLNRNSSTGINENGKNYVNVHFRRWI
jgi:hypothetical protein